MHELKLKPQIQIWVCVNERLHRELPSCQRERGESVIHELHKQIARNRNEKSPEIWINRSLCQGSCTQSGVSIVIEANADGLSIATSKSKRYNGVNAEDVETILAEIQGM
jgi:hypothetical protein